MRIPRPLTLGLFLFLALPSVCPADEFLVYQGDRHFFIGQNGFHYYYQESPNIPVTWPTNWLDPVDYWAGRFAIRIDLKTTPENLPFNLQSCIWMHDGDGTSTTESELESCGQTRLHMSTPGVYTIITDQLRNWWHKNNGANAIDISRPYDFKRMGLVLRTADNCYVSPYNITPNCWDLRYSYLPMEFHLTIVAVSAGATFSGWENYVTPEDDYFMTTWLGNLYVRYRPWVWSFDLNSWLFIPFEINLSNPGGWVYCSDY